MIDSHPDGVNYRAKAVSDGAIIWFIKKTVIARATRYAFGVEVLRSATQERAALLGRPLIEREDGDWIHGYWDEIAPIVRGSEFGDYLPGIN
jgi:hypothetical protein